MNILPFNHIGNNSESIMQENLTKILSKRRYIQGWQYDYPYKVYREIRIPEIKRISDIIIYITDRIVINIECKLENSTSVFEQAIDHAKWADYSYICIHYSAFIPTYLILKMIKNRIGLIYWFGNDQFTEILNGMKIRQTNNIIKTNVLRKLKEIDSIRTGKEENNLQLNLIK